MKKIICLLVFLSFIEIVAHNERTHQYIVRAAYKLLRDLDNTSIPKLGNHIGIKWFYRESKKNI